VARIPPGAEANGKKADYGKKEYFFHRKVFVGKNRKIDLLPRVIARGKCAIFRPSEGFLGDYNHTT
jgi:hypothetical protein